VRQKILGKRLRVGACLFGPDYFSHWLSRSFTSSCDTVGSSFPGIAQATVDLLDGVQFVHDVIVGHVLVEALNELKRGLFGRFGFRDG
jgi:hypothetical protein